MHLIKQMKQTQMWDLVKRIGKS